MRYSRNNWGFVAHGVIYAAVQTLRVLRHPETTKWSKDPVNFALGSKPGVLLFFE